MTTPTQDQQGGNIDRGSQQGQGDTSKQPQQQQQQGDVGREAPRPGNDPTTESNRGADEKGSGTSDQR